MKKKRTYKSYDIYITKSGYFAVYKDCNLLLISLSIKECKRYINYLLNQ